MEKKIRYKNEQPLPAPKDIVLFSEDIYTSPIMQWKKLASVISKTAQEWITSNNLYIRFYIKNIDRGDIYIQLYDYNNEDAGPIKTRGMASNLFSEDYKIYGYNVLLRQLNNLLPDNYLLYSNSKFGNGGNNRIRLKTPDEFSTGVMQEPCTIFDPRSNKVDFLFLYKYVRSDIPIAKIELQRI